MAGVMVSTPVPWACHALPDDAAAAQRSHAGGRRLGSHVSGDPASFVGDEQLLFSTLQCVCAAGMATAAADSALGQEFTPAEPSQEWTEEREAVEAIHGNGASFPSPSRTLLSLPLPAEAATLLRMRPEVEACCCFSFPNICRSSATMVGS